MCGSRLTRIFLAWNLGCGFAQNKDQLIAFRFLSGLGGSAPLAVRSSLFLEIDYVNPFLSDVT